MQTLLVTGGCGFIGSNFIHHILAAHADVTITNLDKLTYAGNPENLADLEQSALSAVGANSSMGKSPEHNSPTPNLQPPTSLPRYRFVHGDIADRQLVDSLLAETSFSGVINFAAESHVDRSILDSTPFIQTNIIGTQVLLDACRKANVPRFVQVSTDEVYGSLGPTGAFTEEWPLAPNSPYSASKASADLLVRAYHHTFGFPGLITRCSNNYGPYQFPEKLLPLFISNAMHDQSLPVYGTGQNVRDWIHVLDHCRGIEAVWLRGNVGEVYNFGGEAEITNLDLTHLLLDLLGKPRSLIRFVQDRPGHDQRYAMDISKVQRELGWTPTVKFADGLKQTIEWYQSHPDWIAHVKSGAYRNYYDQQYGSRLQYSYNYFKKVGGTP